MGLLLQWFSALVHSTLNLDQNTVNYTLIWSPHWIKSLFSAVICVIFRIKLTLQKIMRNIFLVFILFGSCNLNNCYETVVRLGMTNHSIFCNVLIYCQIKLEKGSKQVFLSYLFIWTTVNGNSQYIYTWAEMQPIIIAQLYDRPT